jgi:hypothetical protein
MIFQSIRAKRRADSGGLARWIGSTCERRLLAAAGSCAL